MKVKIGIIATLLIALLASSIYTDAPVVKAPSPPVTVRSAPQLKPDVPYYTSLSETETPVLKQVTAADMRALDLRQPCGFTAAEIESVTKYDLSGLGSDFADQDGKVNAIFLMSVAALESGWGRYKLTQYNLFGMYNYYPQSYSECIDHVAGALKTNYLTQGGEWYHGVTVSAVNIDYCVNADGSPKTSWTDQVSSIMADMYNKIYQAEYQQEISKG